MILFISGLIVASGGFIGLIIGNIYMMLKKKKIRAAMISDRRY